MDTTTFDTLTRSVRSSRTRRSALRGLFTGAATAALASGALLQAEGTDARRKQASCKKKSGDAKKKCLKKARKDNAPDIPQTPTCGTGGPCLVFISSTTHQGNLGGLAGADAICQQRAQDANLPGIYKAWLSDSTNSPNTRFVKSPGPYHLPDGITVADSYADLVDNSIDALINRDEFGQTVTVSDVFDCWTYTDSDGRDFGGNDHCSNWTSTSGEGHYGAAIVTTHNWTNWNSKLCSASHRLYCFQQS